MKTDVITGISSHPLGRIRLTGRVCGIHACELVADTDEIVVGSDITCDLTVPDPLIPPKAFRLRRVKCHAGTEKDCRCYWLLDVFREARTYVNQCLTRHEKLKYGDVLSIGCHELEFGRDTDTQRNLRTNRNVSDICRKLISEYPMPPGFLRNTPTYKYFERRRAALSAAGVLLGILLLCVWLTPRREYMAPVQTAIEIDIVDNILPAKMVRSMEEVARRNFDTTDPTMDKADLTDSKPRIDELTPRPVVGEQPVAPAAPPTLSGPILDSGALNPMPLIADLPDNVEVERETVKLAAAAPAAKQTIAEIESSAEKPMLAKHSEKTEVVEVSALVATEQ
ncbi:FHA domain-containing protein, partial [Verrucomicrobiota bacterium]